MWLLVLPFLSFVLFGAHLLYHWYPIYIAALPIVAMLLWFIPKRWVLRLSQVALVIFAIEWLYSGYALYLVRVHNEMPYMRAVLILVVVALFTALTALVFQNKRLLARYR